MQITAKWGRGKSECTNTVTYFHKPKYSQWIILQLVWALDMTYTSDPCKVHSACYVTSSALGDSNFPSLQFYSPILQWPAAYYNWLITVLRSVEWNMCWIHSKMLNWLRDFIILRNPLECYKSRILTHSRRCLEFRLFEHSSCRVLFRTSCTTT